MLAKPFRFFRIIKALKLSMAVLCVFLLALISATVFLIFNYQRQKSSFQKQEVSLRKEERVGGQPFNFESIKLPKIFETFCEKDLFESLLFLGKNTRPDAKEDQTKALVGLKSSKQSFLVNSGDKLYLMYEEGVLVFSKEPTSLWIKVKGIEDEVLHVDGNFILTNEETNEIYQERLHQIRELTVEEEFQEIFLQSTYFQSIEGAKWWHPDLFYEVYGGQDFEGMKGAQRLELSNQNPSVCFIKPGTRLIFKEESWIVYDNKSNTEQYPMAEVLNVTQAHMEMRIWDVSGMYSKTISLTPERVRPLNIKAEEVFSNIRQRSATQISCKIGSKNSLLKKGDWLLRVGNHWRPLKTLEEIEKYLSFRAQGDLFVFDGIEKNQGITVFKGHLFDTMRGQMQVIQIPLAKQKKSSLKRKKHKELVDFQEPDMLSGDHTFHLEEDKDALLRLTTPQNQHEFSK